MFRALLAHPQEAIHKRQLVYCVRVMSVGCYQYWSGTGQWPMIYGQQNITFIETIVIGNMLTDFYKPRVFAQFNRLHIRSL
jgi:hypothetical protein